MTIKLRQTRAFNLVSRGPQGVAGADGTLLSADVVSAIDAAATPTALNPFATMTDVDLAGVVSRTESTLALVDATRTFTITPTGLTFGVYLGGQLQSKPASSVVIADTVGTHFVYFSASTGELTVSTAPWDITSTDAPVVTIYWDGAAGWLGEERHAPRDAASRALHKRLHSTDGSRYGTGLAGTFTNTTFSVSSGTIYDEDIPNASADQTTCRLVYRNAFSQAVDTPNSAAIYAASAGALQYDNAGALTSVGLNKHIMLWVYATNDPALPIYSVIGQEEFSTPSLARASSQILPPNISTREWVLIYSVMYKNVGGTPTYIEKSDYRAAAQQAGGVVDTIPASSVVTVPTGNLSATNQQATNAELDDEKAAKIVTVATSTGAHTLSADDVDKLTTVNATITIADASVTAITEGQVAQFRNLSAGDLVVATSGTATYKSRSDNTTFSDGGTITIIKLPSADANNFQVIGLSS